MENKIGQLILIRHGESDWNKANIFTGQTDVHLTKDGFRASEKFGLLISDKHIDKVFTSTLARSIETEVCMMSGSENCSTETIFYSDALNERDYGDFVGKNKSDEEKRIGKEEVFKLRRAWNYPVPNGETLKMVYERVIPYFLSEILPILKKGENVLIVSHGNTLRSLVKYIENISDKDIENVEMIFDEIIIYNLLLGRN